MSINQFRQKYGLVEDTSFATPDFTQKRLEIHPSQSYEVTIEGESVIVLGSSLKPMRSKKGYYRLLYQEKLYVLHSTEIREVDRTENDVVSGGLDKTTIRGGGVQADDTDEETTEMPEQNNNVAQQRTISFPAFMQSYSVKLNNTWLTLPSSDVTPSRQMPGFYNVTYQGQVYNVTAVNVIPINNYQPNYPSYSKPQVNVPHRQQIPGATPSKPEQRYPTTTGYNTQLNYPQTVGNTLPNNATNNETSNISNNVTIMPTYTASQVPAVRSKSTSSYISRPDQQSAPQPAAPAYQAFRTPGILQKTTPGSRPFLQQTSSGATTTPEQALPGITPTQQQGYRPLPQNTTSTAGRTPSVIPAVRTATTPSTNMTPRHILAAAPLPPLSTVPPAPASNTNLPDKPVPPSSTLQTSLPNKPVPVSAGTQSYLSSKPVPGTTIPAPRVNPPVEQVTEEVNSLTVSPRRTRPIRRESYTIEKPVTEKVKVLVGGTWRVIEKKMLKPSKKKPETFIARVDERSVRLKPSQIKECNGEDLDVKEEEKKIKLCQVFLDSKYVTIPAEDIEEAPQNTGFKVVTLNGIKQPVHENFIFPVEETEDGPQPTIPNFYRVYLTPEEVIVPKENIKPDESVRNTFMVLWNNVIYKVSADNLKPILSKEPEEVAVEEKEGSTKTEEAVKPRKRSLMDPTIATSARKKSPVKTMKKPIQKLPISKFEKTSVRTIPKRPEGVFPARESEGEEKVEKQQISNNTVSKEIRQSKTSVRAGESEKDNCSRSPYESPVAWDKRLRKMTGQKKKAQNTRPRWTFTTGNKNLNIKSKKLLYKKLMVPSETTEGRYQLFGTPSIKTLQAKSASSLETFLSQHNSSVSDMKSDIKPEGRSSAAASDSVANESTIALSETTRSRKTTTELPYVSDHGDPKALQVTTPGIPVLQDHRILIGPDARANRDWVRSLRAV